MKAEAKFEAHIVLSLGCTVGLADDEAPAVAEKLPRTIAPDGGRPSVSGSARKIGRVKSWELASGEPELGAFMAGESLAVGVLDKLSLWRWRTPVDDRQLAIATVDPDELMIVLRLTTTCWNACVCRRADESLSTFTPPSELGGQ